MLEQAYIEADIKKGSSDIFNLLSHDSHHSGISCLVTLQDKYSFDKSLDRQFSERIVFPNKGIIKFLKLWSLKKAPFWPNSFSALVQSLVFKI